MNNSNVNIFYSLKKPSSVLRSTISRMFSTVCDIFGSKLVVRGIAAQWSKETMVLSLASTATTAFSGMAWTFAIGEDHLFDEVRADWRFG